MFYYVRYLERKWKIDSSTGQNITRKNIEHSTLKGIGYAIGGFLVVTILTVGIVGGRRSYKRRSKKSKTPYCEIDSSREHLTPLFIESVQNNISLGEICSRLRVV